MTLRLSRLFSMVLALLLLVVFTQVAEAAPIRPSPTAQGCSLSGDKIGELQAKNPAAMNACGALANSAAKDGRPFSFMCDTGGKVSCCDDKQCITVVAVTKPPLGPKAQVPMGPAMRK